MGIFLFLGILGFVLLVCCGIVLGQIERGNPKHDWGEFVQASILTLFAAFIVASSFVRVGQSRIKTHKIVEPAHYVIKEINKDGKITKDTTYIYNFNHVK